MKRSAASDCYHVCMDRHVVIDIGGLSYNKLFSLGSKKEVESTGLQKETLLALESEKRFTTWRYDMTMEVIQFLDYWKPNYLTLACDGSKLWRKEIYPEYKTNRNAARDALPIDWDLWKTVRNELVAELEEYLPIRTMHLPKIEADDICYVLVEKLHEEQEIIAYADDKDWYYNFKFPNYRQFKIRDRSEVKGVDPVESLQMKLLTGDAGDNIKNLRPRLGEVTARKIITECSGNIYGWALKEGLLDNFELNQRLINLDRIPKDIKDDIWNAYQSKKVVAVDHMKLMDHFTDTYDLITALNLQKLR